MHLFVPSGKNNGKGYYIYEKGSKPKPDPSVVPIVEESRRLTNIMPGGKVFLVENGHITESSTDSIALIYDLMIWLQVVHKVEVLSDIDI